MVQYFFFPKSQQQKTIKSDRTLPDYQYVYKYAPMLNQWPTNKPKIVNDQPIKNQIKRPTNCHDLTMSNGRETPSLGIYHIFEKNSSKTIDVTVEELHQIHLTTNYHLEQQNL